MKQLFSLIYALLFILGLNSLPSLAQSNKNPILYRCKDGKTFQAQFMGNTVNLQLKRGQILKLTSVATGSGVKYTDGKVTLYAKGEDAFIESNKKTTHNGCTSSTPTSQNSLEVYYNCDSQIAPFPRKEDLSLAEAEKLLIQRDGDLFIVAFSVKKMLALLVRSGES